MTPQTDRGGGDDERMAGAIQSADSEQFELWLKDNMLWSGPDEADAAQKFINRAGPVDFAHA